MLNAAEEADLQSYVQGGGGFVGPGMHFVQYPVRRGELYNQVAVFASKRYTPDSDDWGTPAELEQAAKHAGLD